MDPENVMIFLIGMMAGVIFTILICIAPQGILISQEVADDVCKQITGNESAIAKEDGSKIYGGKLFCIIPSYDETQNIIIKSNSE